ncbi:hypothetical protein REPUB_Repub17cG0146400 [Reevesia pubescens]
MTRSTNFLAMLVSLTISALAIAEISAAPSCIDVTKELAPCLDFLIGNDLANSPSEECCTGAKAIADQAKTDEDRQAVCECLQEALGKVESYDSSRIPQITEKCSVDVYIPPISGDKDYCTRAFSKPFV